MAKEKLSREKQEELIAGEIIATVAGIVAGIISAVGLVALREQTDGVFPDKDYTYVNDIYKIALWLFFGAALYYAYSAYAEMEANPDNSKLTIVFVSNIMYLVALAFKLYVVYTKDDPTRKENETRDEIDTQIAL